MLRKTKKIVILGAGKVGSASAFILAADGLGSEIVLIDSNKEKAQGEAMDIIQGSSVNNKPIRIYAGDYADAEGADIVVVTMGMPRKPGQTRLDLAQCNVDIIRETMPEVARRAPHAIYIVVSNPVDIITHAILKYTNLDRRQVIGSGTMLDTARLRSLLSRHMDINAHNVHAFVFGEHGDTAVIPWSLVTVAGMSMIEYCENICVMHNHCRKLELRDIENDMRTSGGKIIALKGATYYAIALVVKRMCEAVIGDAKSTLTVSSMLQGEYGIHDVCLSIPYLIGAHGIIKPMPPTLAEDELKALHASADALKKVIAELKW